MGKLHSPLSIGYVLIYDFIYKIEQYFLYLLKVCNLLPNVYFSFFLLNPNETQEKCLKYLPFNPH